MLFYTLDRELHSLTPTPPKRHPTLTPLFLLPLRRHPRRPIHTLHQIIPGVWHHHAPPATPHPRLGHHHQQESGDDHRLTGGGPVGLFRKGNGTRRVKQGEECRLDARGELLEEGFRVVRAGDAV